MQAVTRESMILDRQVVRAAAQRLAGTDNVLASDVATLLDAIADAWQAGDRACTVGELTRWTPVCESATRFSGRIVGARP